MRTAFILGAALLVAGCSRPEAPAPESKPAASGAAETEAAGEIKRYPFRGKVIGKDPKSGLAMIEHEAVADYMDAMTMSYKIADKKVYESLKEGDKIRATLVVQADGFTAHLEDVSKQ